MTEFTPLIIGVTLDVIDYVVVGLVPYLGDIIDLIGVAYFFNKLGPTALAGLVELIPAVDVLPTFTFLGAFTAFRGKRHD